MEARTLHTERLVLLPLGPPDLDETAALYRDPEVMRHVIGGVKDRAETASALEEVAADWRHCGYGLWAIRDATTGAFLGEGGLQPMPDLENAFDAAVDFGYTLCRRGWGKSYATEAGQVMLRDAWLHYRGDQIHALVASSNLPSQRVLEKLGFERIAELSHDGQPHELWRVERSAPASP